MTAKERLQDEGYEDVIIFDNPSYDDVLIGVSSNNQAIYDYDKMIDWLVNKQDMSVEEAADFISYNSSFFIGDEYPIVMYPVD